MSALTEATRARLREALDKLESVDCDCSLILVECDCRECSEPDKRGNKKGRRARLHPDFIAPCEHLLVAGLPVRISQAWWSRLLCLLNGDPPIPSRPSNQVERAAVVNMMLLRRLRGEGLFHPKDAHRAENLCRLGVAVRSKGRTANGVGLIEGGLVTEGGKS